MVARLRALANFSALVPEGDWETHDEDDERELAWLPTEWPSSPGPLTEPILTSSPLKRPGFNGPDLALSVGADLELGAMSDPPPTGATPCLTHGVTPVLCHACACEPLGCGQQGRERQGFERAYATARKSLAS